MPSSWATRSRAKRLASSTTTAHGPDAVVLDAVEQGGEPRPCLDRVGARYRRVIKPIHHGHAGPPGIGFDRGALPPLAILVGCRSP
jgi:hypothetical protein